MYLIHLDKSQQICSLPISRKYTLKEVVMLQFNDGYHWHLLYGQDYLNETINIVSE